MQVDEPPVATPPPRGGAKSLLLLAGAFLVTLVCAAGLWLAISARSAGFEATLPWSPANPSRGCPSPTVSLEEAIYEARDLLSFTGTTVGQPVVASARYVTGGVAAILRGHDLSDAEPGCAWVLELHVNYAFTRQQALAPRSAGATPTPITPTWQRIEVIVGVSEDGPSSSSLADGLPFCAGIGTPCPTHPPPASGWPTAIPVALPTGGWVPDVVRTLLPQPSVPPNPP